MASPHVLAWERMASPVMSSPSSTLRYEVWASDGGGIDKRLKQRLLQWPADQQRAADQGL